MKDKIRGSETRNYVSWQDWKLQVPQFVNRVLSFSSEIGLNVYDLQIDHICLRLKTEEHVTHLRDDLRMVAEKLSEVSVNGRPIMIWKFHEPLKVKVFSIPCLELPFPATDHDYSTDGWEHVEFVLKGTDSVENLFKAKFPEYSGSYKITTPKVEGEQIENSTLVIKSQKDRMLAIKFHKHSIEDIVRSGQIGT